MDQRPLLTDAIIGCALAPDGKQVALVNAQQQIYIYNSDHWSLIDSFTGHLDDILDCVFADDQTLISVSKDRTIQKWNLQNKEHILVGSHQHWISCCAVYPQKSTLLSAGWDRRIGLWDLLEPRLVQQYGGHEDAITRILWRTDGQLFASMSQDRTFRIWDINNTIPIATSPRQDSWLLCGQFMAHSMRLLTGAFDGKLRLWDFEYSTSTPIAEFRGHTDGVTDCALSPNQKWLATTSWDNTIRLWNVESQHCQVVLPVQSRLTRCLWVKDDLLLATSRNGCYLLDVLT